MLHRVSYAIRPSPGPNMQIPPLQGECGDELLVEAEVGRAAPDNEAGGVHFAVNSGANGGRARGAAPHGADGV